MASTSKIIEAMNSMALDDKEDEGLAFEEEAGEKSFDGSRDFNAELCLVERFLFEGAIDFTAMKQTMAALWRPGKGVYINGGGRKFICILVLSRG